MPRAATRAVDVATDYRGRPLRAGDWAVGIESGWLGRIEEITAEDVPIGDGRSFTEFMCRMTGVCDLSMLVAGLTAEEAISPDDVQHYAAPDLLRIEPHAAT